ncbi:hypothetical protein BASA83_005461 [Batrachochytrium salamandrivorans]|nr:hypothetical protein BASA83_005461 [Batrachochytrium salamandrivorans]
MHSKPPSPIPHVPPTASASIDQKQGHVLEQSDLAKEARAMTASAGPSGTPVSTHIYNQGIDGHNETVHHLYNQVVAEVHTKDRPSPHSRSSTPQSVSRYQLPEASLEEQTQPSLSSFNDTTLKSDSQVAPANTVILQLDAEALKQAHSPNPALSYIGGESQVGMMLDGSAVGQSPYPNLPLDGAYPPSMHKYSEDDMEFRRFSLRRTLSRFSRQSKRTFISNVSAINRHNLRRFGRSKVAFLIANTIFVFLGLLALLYGVLTFIDTSLYIKIGGVTTIVVLLSMGAVQILAGIVGYCGALLHRKTLLIFFMIAIWPLVFGYLYVGYTTYRQLHSTQWERSISESWNTLNSTQGTFQEQTMGLFKRQDPAPVPDAPVPDAPVPDAPTPDAPTPDTPAPAPGVPITPPIAPPGSRGSTPALPGCHNAWAESATQYLRTSYIVSFSIVAFLFLMFVVLILGTNHIYMD